MKKLIVIVLISSLLANLYYIQFDQNAVFYLFHFRAWELLVGVVLAVHCSGSSARVDYPQIISWAGIALILASILFVEPGKHFPGWFAVPPVLGTFLVLLNGRQNNIVNNLLSHRVPVLIGLLSYSLYLWHWPVLTLSKYYRVEYDGLVEVTFWIALSFVLAYVSWQFVEKPFRFGMANAGSKMVFGGAALASCFSITMGGLAYLNDGYAQRFGPNVLAHIKASGDFIQNWDDCFTGKDGVLAGIRQCPIGVPGRPPQILVWGDSHLRAFREGLDVLAKEQNVSAVIVWRAGCPALFGVRKVESASTPLEDRGCLTEVKSIEAAVAELHNIKRVVFVGRWAYYAEGTGVGIDAHNTIALSSLSEANTVSSSQAMIYARAVRGTMDTLRALGKELFVVRQVPEIPNYISQRVARLIANGTVATEEQLQEFTVVPKVEVEDRTAASEAPFRSLERDGTIQFLNTWEYFCQNETCSSMRDGAALYFDNNHITNTASVNLRNILRPAFTLERRSE